MVNTRTRIAAIIIKDSKLLLVQGKGSEVWTPGGKIEENESDEICLRRELKEEINADLNKMNFFKQYTAPNPFKPKEITIEKVYLVSISGKLTVNFEIENLIWLTKTDYLNNKYNILPTTKNKIIPDLINAGLF